MFAAAEFMECDEYFAVSDFETVTNSQTFLTSRKKRKKKKSNSMNRRRFSDEQIRSLESIFYSSEDSKLDPRKKVKLATDLGLQPRQVAIWFQNRRARWKSKQIENDFTSLRANYDNLVSQFKSLQEEKNSLLKQLQKLNELVKEKPQTRFETETAKPESLQGEEENRGNMNWMESNEGQGHDGQGIQETNTFEDQKSNIRYNEEEEYQILNVNGSSESSTFDTWPYGFDTGGSIFEYQPSGSLQWQSFWG